MSLSGSNAVSVDRSCSLAARSPLSAAQAQLRGHGGPVRALAISPDGSEAISGSFDTSAIRWSLKRNVAEQVMRFHDNAVNAVAWLKDGRIVTAGADAHIAIWTPGKPEPDRVLNGHIGPDRRPRGVAGRQDAGVGVMGSHHPALAAQRRRQAARAGRQCAERQRRRFHARRQRAGERRLRRDAAHLAVARRRFGGRAQAAERRSIPRRSRPTARSSPPAPTARSISSRRKALSKPR